MSKTEENIVAVVLLYINSILCFLPGMILGLFPVEMIISHLNKKAGYTRLTIGESPYNTLYWNWILPI